MAFACDDLLQEPDTRLLPAPVRLETVSGNGQIGAVGVTLTEPLRVRLIDREGQPIARLRVEWIAPGGSGEPEPRNSCSDANGIAQTTWILGPAMTFVATAVTP